MKLVRIVRLPGYRYLIIGPFLNKSIEVGVQLAARRGFFLNLDVKTKGDHAGVRLYVELFGVLFECAFHDVRHWNWCLDRWMFPGERELETW